MSFEKKEKKEGGCAQQSTPYPKRKKNREISLKKKRKKREKKEKKEKQARKTKRGL